MPTCEEYLERAKRARQEAKVCRNEWERQRLIMIADQLEQIACYKGLTSERPDNAGESNHLSQVALDGSASRGAPGFLEGTN
jgi:hypothetical protein